jgi:hypothetical protein
MKTVPTVRLADTTDAAALPDLPKDIQLAMTDIAGAAREGLLAMSVAAGRAVMTAMFEAEIAEVRAEGQARPGPGRGAPWPREGVGDPGPAAGAGGSDAGAHPGWARGAVSQLHPLRRR